MKKRYYWFLFPLIAAVVLLSTAFQESPQDKRALEIQALINAEIAERVSKYRKSRMDRCRRNIMKEANRQADSMMIAKVKTLQLIDTLTRPDRKERPILPELLNPIDTSPAAPLLPLDSISLDSIFPDSSSNR